MPERGTTAEGLSWIRPLHMQASKELRTNGSEVGNRRAFKGQAAVSAHMQNLSWGS